MNAVVVNGLFVGLVYALLGIGLVIAYRGSRVVNFAHGETGMVAAFLFADIRHGTAQVTLQVADRGLWLALPAAVLVGAAIGALTEYFVVRPLRDAPRIRPLVGTFALGSLLLVFAIRRWGTEPRFVAPLREGVGVEVLGLRVQPQQLIILVVTAAVLVALWALQRFTPFGLRLRATAMDPYGAGLVGVDVNRTSLATWALAGALAGVAAVLIAPLVAFRTVFMTILFIRALAAAVVGGLTSIWGTVAAGVAVGILEGVISYASPVSGVTDVLVAGAVIVLMLFRPAGLVRSAY